MEKNFKDWLVRKEMKFERVTEFKNQDGKPALLWVECKNYYQKAMAMIEMQEFFYKGGQPSEGIIVWNDAEEGENCMQFRGYDSTVEKLLQTYKTVGSRGFFNEKINDYEWKAVKADVTKVRAFLFELLNITNL